MAAYPPPEGPGKGEGAAPAEPPNKKPKPPRGGGKGVLKTQILKVVGLGCCCKGGASPPQPKQPPAGTGL